MMAARVGEQSDVEWKFVYRSPLFAMRSMAGVGMTPPNVPGAPKPQSSVMMSSTLGAPLGGTTRGGHHGFDSVAFSAITPPNFGSGGGSCLPSSVVVALGEPRVPVTCWAPADTTTPSARDRPSMANLLFGALMGSPYPDPRNLDRWLLCGRAYSFHFFSAQNLVPWTVSSADRPFLVNW